ncbi:MAG: class I SAM-dependent RNA methyltransferase [Bdellovibrionales bacterium]
MALFFASTQKGLRDALEKEIKDLGIQRVWTKDNEVGVYFEGSWKDCYKVNLCSRTASRVLMPILDFPAYKNEEYYNNVRKHDFTKYIESNQGIYVDAVVNNSGQFRDQRFVAMLTKDAIVDQFRDKYGDRPSVINRASLRVHVRMNKNQVNLAVDTSGYPLFQRGYREEAGDAPLKETLAAGLINMAEWDRKKIIVDPMCGSGTILIEAAMMFLNMAPGSNRKKFAFQDYKFFDKEDFNEVLNEVLDQEIEYEEEAPMFYGYDVSNKMIKIAERNASLAGVDHLIHFERRNVVHLEKEFDEEIMIITNPPYGERLGDVHELQDVYKDFGHILKERFSNNTAWILSGSSELPKFLKLKASRKMPVYNGNLECRFLKYEINK